MFTFRFKTIQFVQNKLSLALYLIRKNNNHDINSNILN